MIDDDPLGDLDDGWGDDDGESEPAPETRAVPSAELLAKAGDKAKPSSRTPPAPKGDAASDGDVALALDALDDLRLELELPPNTKPTPVPTGDSGYLNAVVLGPADTAKGSSSTAKSKKSSGTEKRALRNGLDLEEMKPATKRSSPELAATAAKATSAGAERETKSSDRPRKKGLASRLPSRLPPPPRPPRPQVTKPSGKKTAPSLPKPSVLSKAVRSEPKLAAQDVHERKASRSLTPFVRNAAEQAKQLDSRATLPPPVDQDELVSKMMDSGEIGRPPLDTITEADPLQFDVPSSRDRGLGMRAPKPPSFAKKAPSAGDDAAEGAPEIETVEVELDDLDPQLLRDTPVPPRPDEPEIDLLDDLAATAQLPVADAMALARDADRLAELDDLIVDDSLGSVPPPASGELSFERSTSEPPSSAPPISDIPLSASTVAASTEDDELIAPIEERFAVGDYSGALVLAEAALEEHPGHEAVERYLDSCRDMLRQMYISRLGQGTDVPRVAMSAEQLRWLTLDHRAGFLLSCIDGMSSIDEVLDVATMPVLEALRTLYELVQEGVVEIVPGS